MAARQALILAALAALAAGRLLTPPAAKVPAKEEKKAAPVKLHTNASSAPSAKKPTPVAATKKNTTVVAQKKKNATVAKKNMTADEQIASLQQGLHAIEKLRTVFTAPEPGAKGDLEEFAQGAMTTELSKKDSPVWDTISNMLSATSKIMGQLKGKSKADQEKLMDGLEKDLNGKAAGLRKVTEHAGEVQEQRSEEYLLGVLMQHQKDWSIEKQVNATKTFTSTCTAAAELLKHYNPKEPLAPQFAALMDAEKAKKGAKVAADKAAAKLFIQLADSLRVGRA